MAGDGSAQNTLLGATEDEREPAMGAMPQREADLVPLWLAVQRAAPGAPRVAARAELAAALDARRVRAARSVRCRFCGLGFRPGLSAPPRAPISPPRWARVGCAQHVVLEFRI